LQIELQITLNQPEIGPIYNLLINTKI